MREQACHLYTKTMSWPTLRVLARLEVAPGVMTTLYQRYR